MVKEEGRSGLYSGCPSARYKGWPVLIYIFNQMGCVCMKPDPGQNIMDRPPSARLLPTDSNKSHTIQSSPTVRHPDEDEDSHAETLE